MIAQVASFKLHEGAWPKVVDLCKRWQHDHAEHTDGFKETYIWRDNREPLNCTALIVFADIESLDKFSANPATTKFFEEMKSLIDGDVDYYHAETLNADLINSAVVH